MPQFNVNRPRNLVTTCFSMKHLVNFDKAGMWRISTDINKQLESMC